MTASPPGSPPIPPWSPTATPRSEPPAPAPKRLAQRRMRYEERLREQQAIVAQSAESAPGSSEGVGATEPDNGPDTVPLELLQQEPQHAGYVVGSMAGETTQHESVGAGSSVHEPDRPDSIDWSDPPAVTEGRVAASPAPPSGVEGYSPASLALESANEFAAIESLGRSRGGPVWRRPKPSIPAIAVALLVHAVAVWFLLHYGPKLPLPGGSGGPGDGRPAFTFTFRPVATVRLIDESAEQLQGLPQAPKAASAKPAVFSSNPTLSLISTVTTTLPELVPESEPAAGVAVPQVTLKSSPTLSPQLTPTPTEAKPEAASEEVPLAPRPSRRFVDGSSSSASPEPAALPRPVLQTTATPLANDRLAPAPLIPVLPPPSKPEPVRRNLAASLPASPTAVEPVRELPQLAAQPQVAPITIQITVPQAVLQPLASIPPPAVAPTLPASSPNANLTPPPVASPSAVQVIVNVATPGGLALPAGVPSTLNVPGTLGVGAAGPGQGSSGSSVRGGTSGSGAGLSGGVGTGAAAGPGAERGSANAQAAAASSAGAARPLNLTLPGRGPYATPPRQRSLADMANEQLRQGMATTQIERGVNSAGKPDCVSEERARQSGGGLLALPALVWDAATGKCK